MWRDVEKIKQRVERTRVRRQKRKADEKRHEECARNWIRLTHQTDAFIPRRERTCYDPLKVSEVPNSFRYRDSEEESRVRRNFESPGASTPFINTASVTGMRRILKRPSVGADEHVGDAGYLGTGESAADSAEDIER